MKSRLDTSRPPTLPRNAPYRDVPQNQGARRPAHCDLAHRDVARRVTPKSRDFDLRDIEYSNGENEQAERFGAERFGAERFGNVLDFDEARDARWQRDENARLEAEQRAQLEARRAERSRREKRLEERRAQMARQEEKRQKKLANCPACHWGLMVATILLALFSIPIVYSASTALALDRHDSADFFLIRQAGAAAGGLFLFWVMSRLSAKGLRVAVWGLYAFALIGLLLIDFTPLGASLGSGTRRWLKLPLFPLQISEFAKIALIGVMADFWSRAARPSQGKMWPWLVASALALPFIGLVFLQPHLSAALLLLTIPFVVAAHADVPRLHFARILVPLALCGIVTIVACKNHAVPFLKTYQQDRIANHFGNGDKTKGAGEKDGNYQVDQSMRALVHGGVFGVGPGESLFKQGHLPAPHTDFILAVIGEEWGLVGLLVILFIYSAMIFFCLHVGHCAQTGFEALLCSGVGTLLAIQVLGNAFVVTGIFPVTGIPLPLLSYGGSGLLCTLMGIGMVLGVSRRLGQAQASEKQENANFQTADSDSKTLPKRAATAPAKRASLTA